METHQLGEPGPTDSQGPELSQMEQKIANAWTSILGVERIGLDDNFFALGGDSMQMMTLLLQAQDEFGVVVGRESLFRFPTLREFCELISAARARSETGVI